MKLGVITDIHSNIAALDAVLKEMRIRAIDGIICLGDIIGIGPYPEECVSRMMELEGLMACVSGNHESYLLNGIPDWIVGEEREFHEWEHARLSEKSRAFISGLGTETRLEIGGLKIWAAHYPIDGRDYAPLSPKDTRDICPTSDICLYGHDHFRSIFVCEGRVWADFGALGCPGTDKNIARAGIITIENGASKVETLDIAYDPAPMTRAFEAFKCPARKTVLRIFYGAEI